ncbi:SpoIIE family protein phosphatase [Geodermatophilus sabuli]|uniref:Bacteriophytochrome (Light-regulated signal transduction histidine kinase) n=1 Tax=Geodermatophilus sabuli TaxID=1564158 RepID=A0A285EI15_9ACTN|nr:SpoIIE family protein phosphatase [Geodermatophilus sabuli]MBB3086697.1 light-regulated signal transduction histidine kinase (bacteriophytochrome) [Geodermatophilus sabuli]SNX97651.1 Bacteriophytochrome (light-regulated signal transduction histidine kinase) [Geodermatophilus sabuli]
MTSTVPRPEMPGVSNDALARCADEPIAVPGAIQPHGALLAVTEPDLGVVVASANAAELLGVAPAALPELLAADDLARLRAGLAGDLAELNPLRVTVGGAEVDVVVSRADGLLLTEWEPVEGAGQAGAAWHRRLPAVLQRLSATTGLGELTAVLARDVRELTGFDRVMVYRFDAEWNGEVVAEDRRADLEPFLGLRYPASDIPAQARALYTVNWQRLIPDARYRPVPLDPPVHPGTGRPLDLSGSILRSVSPVHLEYLANMGVVASMSVSLIDRGRLWGLISCHHYAGPHRPSYADRVAAEFLGRTASLLLHTTAETADRGEVVGVAQRQAQLVAAVGRTPRDPGAALTGGDRTVLDLLPAAGSAVRLDGRLRLLGSTPPADRVAGLVEALRATGQPATDALGRVVPAAADVADTASGLLAVEVGGGNGDFLAWFRPETLREVTWGGNPHTPKTVETDAGPRLSPRRSFAAWSETVRGTAAPWRVHEVAAAQALAAHLTETRLQRAGEDSRLAAVLQRTLLLEELPKVPGLTLAAHYRPIAADVVGGDWYDLVPLPSGRVSVVLGDVAGHGLAAAAITAQLRHALRAHLLRDLGPGVALSGLGALVAALLPGELATVVVAEVDPATGAVVVASAGHLPVLHVGAGGATLVTDGRGPALGLLDAADYSEVRLQLAGDDRLLLYSDGLVERRDVPLPERLDTLRAAVTAGRPLEVLLDDVLTALDPPDVDDVTLVGLGRT